MSPAGGKPEAISHKMRHNSISAIEFAAFTYTLTRSHVLNILIILINDKSRIIALGIMSRHVWSQ